MRRFSSTVSGGKIAVPPMSWTMPIFTRSSASAKVTVRPLNRTTPRCGTPRPLTTRNSVDFPAPFVPSSASVSPLYTSSDTSKSTCTLPYEKSRLRTWITGESAPCSWSLRFSSRSSSSSSTTRATS